MKTKDKITGELLKAIEYIDISNDPRDVLEFHNSRNYYEITNFVNDGIVIAYTQEALQHLEEALNHVFDFRNDLSKILSEVFVMRNLKEIIKNALLNEDPNKDNLIISDVEKFLSKIEKEDFIYFLRVFNLKCSKTYDFGTVRLYPNKTVFMKAVGEKYHLNKKEIEILDKYIEKKESDKEHCIAEVHILSAEEVNAREKAFYDLDHFINILRCLNERNKIWIEGEASPVHRSYFRYYEKTKNLCFGFERLDEKNGMIEPFDLDKLYGFNPQLMNRLESVLKRENRTSMESKIINSLTWLGESVKEKDDVHKLLKMIIALECLLLENEANKKYLLAERCAFLLSNRFEDRIRTKELIVDVYGLRNATIHEGKRPNIRKNVSKGLFTLIRKLNVKFLLYDEFKSMKDVREFVEQVKYGPKIEKIKNQERVRIIEGN
jgi:hypothetical protein